MPESRYEPASDRPPLQQARNEHFGGEGVRGVGDEQKNAGENFAKIGSLLERFGSEPYDYRLFI